MVGSEPRTTGKHTSVSANMVSLRLISPENKKRNSMRSNLRFQKSSLRNIKISLCTSYYQHYEVPTGLSDIIDTEKEGMEAKHDFALSLEHENLDYRDHGW